MQIPTFKLDFKWLLIAALGLTIGIMLVIWHPWRADSSRTIEVTGSGSIAAVPDEFTFYPAYQATGTSSKTAIAKVSITGNEVVAKLKTIGLADNDITTQVNTGYSGGCRGNLCPLSDSARPEILTSNTATYSITAVAHGKDTAQKVLDYLVTTDTTYGVFPASGFSLDTQTNLELQARSKALENARSKAEQTAQELGTKLGKVISVSDLNQIGGPFLLKGSSSPSATDETANQSPTLETGTQNLSFTITVTYQIR